MHNNKWLILISQLIIIFVCFLFARGCGSAGGEPGACKPSGRGNSYTASTTDFDGKPWTFQISPRGADVLCSNPTDAGQFVFTGFITNGQNIPQAGLSTAPVLSGEQPSLFRDNKDGVVISDSCGSVQYTLKWTCPPIGMSIGGTFSGRSGALFSSPVSITIKNTVATPTPTPAPPIILQLPPSR